MDMNCGSAFELPYNCTSICVRSSCNWRARCVGSNPQKKKWVYFPLNRRRSIVFRVLFQQKNKKTNQAWSIAGVPLIRALPGYTITATPPVCVADLIGALAVWPQNTETKTYSTQTNFLHSQSETVYIMWKMLVHTPWHLYCPWVSAAITHL